MITSKADKDRIRQRAGAKKIIMAAAIKAVREFEQGRPLTECFADLRRAVKQAGA